MLEISNLHASTASKAILDELSLSIDAGEVRANMEASALSKTTFGTGNC